MAPWPTSVKTITAKASQMSNARGYGSPSARVSGSASAAARVTTPRIPAQPMMIGNFGDGLGSRRRTRGTNRAR